MIPKKIHYCWFGNNPMPKLLKKCLKTWKKKCPDYEIIKWDESNFDINCSKFVKDAYDNKAWAFVSDVARLMIIYENGGIYLDTDVELYKSLDSLLDCDAFFGFQQADNQINTGLCFGAKKNSKIIKKMINKYDDIDFNLSKKSEFICPILNSKVIFDNGFTVSNKIQNINNVVVYPAKYFDPIAPGNSKNLLSPESFSIHHYSATWTNKSNRIKRNIINFLGQEKINKLKKIIKQKG